VQLYAQKDNGRQKKRRRKRFSVTEEEDSGPEEEEKGCRDWAVKNRAHTHVFIFALWDSIKNAAACQYRHYENTPLPGSLVHPQVRDSF
jgi:hypothetical protein